MKIRWVEKTGMYASGESLLLGKYAVGSWHIGITASVSGNRYRATCALPGLKGDQGAFATPEEAKSRVERAVRLWLSNAFEPGDGKEGSDGTV